MNAFRIIVLILAISGMMLFLPDILTAQPPPALPGAPDQAPIDGGVGLLAAAGAAYAWKKLRKEKVVK
ncbi:MAG: hypothetical protein LAT57_04535 [Balneolales bacterium]|nr:hypothetical protein [Balneolales bacterium]